METLICLFLGFLGVCIHSAIKFNSLQKDATAANMTFDFKDYLKKDWLGIALSFLAVLAWIFLFGEVSKVYPKIETYIRCSFLGMGALGSYFLQTAFSRGKKIIRTNIADNVINKQQ